jgi:glycosyltransferase involved in cell wall biosynthesis
MATGTPIIAYGKWWGLETVVENKTWVFFGEQTSESLNKKIEDFEKLDFDSNEIRKHAENFDKEVFKENLKKFILEKINKK